MSDEPNAPGPPPYTPGLRGAQLIHNDQNQIIGFRLRNQNFHGAQAIINFINSFQDIDLRLQVLEEFQDAAKKATDDFMASINDIWTWVEGDDLIQRAAAGQRQRFNNTFSDLRTIALNHRRERDRVGELRRRLAPWVSDAFMNIVVGTMTNNSTGVLDELVRARNAGFSPLAAMQRADVERLQRLARLGNYVRYGQRNRQITSGDIRNGYRATHQPNRPEWQATLTQAAMTNNLLTGPAGLRFVAGGIPRDINLATANEGHPMRVTPAGEPQGTPQVQTIRTERHATPSGMGSTGSEDVRQSIESDARSGEPSGYNLRRRGPTNYGGMQAPAARPESGSRALVLYSPSPPASVSGAQPFVDLRNIPPVPRELSPAPSQISGRHGSAQPSVGGTQVGVEPGSRQTTPTQQGPATSASRQTTPVPQPSGTGHGSQITGSVHGRSESPQSPSARGSPDPKRQRQDRSPRAAPTHPAEVMSYIDELVVRTRNLKLTADRLDARAIRCPLPQNAPDAQRHLWNLFNTKAQSVAQNTQFRIGDEDRQFLAERHVTANLSRDVRAIVDALNQTYPRPADASIAAYLEGASTVTQLALSNELHQGNPVAVRQIIQEIVGMYHGAPIVAGQGGDWHQQGVTVDQHDLETMLLDPLHRGWLNESMIQALLLMMTHRAFETASRNNLPGPSNFVVPSGPLSAWRGWTGPTQRDPTRPVPILPNEPRRLVMPIHWGNHWAMATYDPITHHIQYWDSHPSPEARQRNMTEAYTFLSLLLNEYRGTLVLQQFRSQAPTRGQLTSQVQTNTADCGIFAIENARRFIEETGDMPTNIAPITTALRSHLLDEFRVYLEMEQHIPDRAQAYQQQRQRREELRSRGGQTQDRPFSISASPSPARSPSLAPRINTDINGLQDLTITDRPRSGSGTPRAQPRQSPS